MLIVIPSEENTICLSNFKWSVLKTYIEITLYRLNKIYTYMYVCMFTHPLHFRKWRPFIYTLKSMCLINIFDSSVCLSPLSLCFSFSSLLHAGTYTLFRYPYSAYDSFCCLSFDSSLRCISSCYRVFSHNTDTTLTLYPS